MKLSIIVPIYNVEAYLCRCVESILSQTFSDFELILVDDGSPDACPQICDEYARKDPRVRVIHKKNGGLSDARNAGIEIAKGEYIGFVDSDDTISPDMYQRLITLLETYHADIAATGFINYDSNGVELTRYPDLPRARVFYRKDYIDQFYPETKWLIFASACNKLYRRTLFNSLRYPVGMLYEDSFLQLPLYDLCDSIVVDNQHHYHYYTERNESIMNMRYTAKKFQLIELAMSQYDFFVKKENQQQQEYALATYVTNYMINYFAVFFCYRELKEAFRPYRKRFRGFFLKIMKNTRICRMKKITVLMMYINNKKSLTLCRKYFPECLPDFLRS